MAIQIGAPVPDVELKVMGEERPESVRTGELFQDKRVVLFRYPVHLRLHVRSFICQDILSYPTKFVPTVWNSLSAFQ